MCVKAHRHVGRLLVIDEVYQGIGKPKLGIGITSLAGYAGVAYQCVICPEHQRQGIKQKQFLTHGTKLGLIVRGDGRTAYDLSVSGLCAGRSPGSRVFLFILVKETQVNSKCQGRKSKYIHEDTSMPFFHWRFGFD
jgi:hypothetical protein